MPCRNDDYKVIITLREYYITKSEYLSIAISQKVRVSRKKIFSSFIMIKSIRGEI